MLEPISPAALAACDQLKSEIRNRMDKILDGLVESIAKCQCPETGYSGPIHTAVIWQALDQAALTGPDGEQAARAAQAALLGEAIVRLLDARLTNRAHR